MVGRRKGGPASDVNVVEEKEEGRVVTRLYAIKPHGVHHSVRDTATYTRDCADPGARRCGCGVAGTFVVGHDGSVAESADI